MEVSGKFQDEPARQAAATTAGPLQCCSHVVLRVAVQRFPRNCSNKDPANERSRLGKVAEWQGLALRGASRHLATSHTAQLVVSAS